jgi:CRP-like cAMP-binding protein
MLLLKRRSEKIELLRKVPLFSELGRRHLNVIAGVADEVKVEAGTALARQGRLGREFVLIVDGSARVETDGKVLARLEAGDFCGEMSLIDGKPRCATVVAESPCVLLVVHTRSFRRLLDAVPGLQRKILITVCQRLRDADAALAAVN